jgi:hypothetical protein
MNLASTCHLQRVERLARAKTRRVWLRAPEEKEGRFLIAVQASRSAGKYAIERSAS